MNPQFRVLGRLHDDHTSLFRVRGTEVVLVALAAGSVFAAAWIARIQAIGSHEQALVVVTVLAGAAGLAAAVLWALCSRLTVDGRVAWGAGALATYGLIAVPATTLGSVLEAGRAITGTVRLTAHIMVVVMLLMCSCSWMRDARVRGFALFGIAVLVAVCMAGLAAVIPETALTVTTFLPIRWTVVLLWVVAGALICRRALLDGTAPIFRAGLGVLLLAFAHGYRVLIEAAQPATMPCLTFCTLRLIALAIVLTGAFQVTLEALRRIGKQHLDHQEQLRRAEEGLARLADRDRGLREGIASMAGVADLLRDSLVTDDEAVLGAAVTAEIARLDALLSQAADGSRHSSAARNVYDVHAIVRDVTVLQLASGVKVSCDVPAGLLVLGSAGVMSQILVNVFANCARHAPGSPILVRATAAGDPCCDTGDRQRSGSARRRSGDGVPPGCPRRGVHRQWPRPVHMP